MRVLPERTDHGGRGAARQDGASYRRADQLGDVGESLPVGDVRPDPERDSAGGAGRRCAMSPVSRRDFIVAGAAAGAGLVIGVYLPHGRKHSHAFSPNAYLKITPDNQVTVVVARSEMGQGVRTSLPMILAEELEGDWRRITIEQAGASTLYGDQTTGGSASVRTTWDPMRKAGAA